MWCQEVTERLRKHGHEVVILTSNHDRHLITNTEPDWLHRDLFLEMDLASFKNALQFFTTRQQRETTNLNCLRELITQYQPDAMIVWGMWNLPRSLAVLAESLMNGRIVYYFGDYWPSLPSQFENYWHAPAQSLLTSIPKLLLAIPARYQLGREPRPELQLTHALFPTDFMRQDYRAKKIRFEHSAIVFGGVNTESYLTLPIRTPNKSDICLLYIGRLVEDKGVHTAIEAAGKLLKSGRLPNLKLTIVGTGEPEYEEQLHQLVKKNTLENQVMFLGNQTPEQIVSHYRQADIFLFTSIWQEPFGRVIVEAMASGTAVIGTGTGGSKEILIHEQNGLTYTPGDVDELAIQIHRLVTNEILYTQLTAEARKTAAEQFDMHRMAMEIEQYLYQHIKVS